MSGWTNESCWTNVSCLTNESCWTNASCQKNENCWTNDSWRTNMRCWVVKQMWDVEQIRVVRTTSAFEQIWVI